MNLEYSITMAKLCLAHAPGCSLQVLAVPWNGLSALPAGVVKNNMYTRLL